MTMLFPRCLPSVFLLGLLSFSSGQEASLYGPGMPDDAAFIRALHAVQDGPEVEVVIGGGLSGESLSFGEVTGYELVLEGETPIVIEFDGERLEVTIDAAIGAFYTVALVGSPDEPEALVIEDEVSDSLARALLALYNFSDVTLDLRTADGETEIVTSVGFGEAEGVMVNPVTVELGIFSDGELLYALEDVTLEAGEAYSVVVFGPPEVEGAVALVRATGQ
jgi:hypothetical protein